MQLAKKEMVDASQEVLSAAVDSDNEAKAAVQKDEEAAKSAFEIAGMPLAAEAQKPQQAPQKPSAAPITLTLA